MDRPAQVYSLGIDDPQAAEVRKSSICDVTSSCRNFENHIGILLVRTENAEREHLEEI